VVLNVTVGLQEAAQRALAADIAADKKTKDPTTGNLPTATDGAVVVMNVETGAVLALASYPSYSLTKWVGGISSATYQALTAGCQSTSAACPLNDNAIQGPTPRARPSSWPPPPPPPARAHHAVDLGGRHRGLPRQDNNMQDGLHIQDATASDAGVVNVTSP